MLTGRCNPVQEALAAEQSLFRKEPKVYKTADGSIDRRRAASPYKEALSLIDQESGLSPSREMAKKLSLLRAASDDTSDPDSPLRDDFKP